MTTTCFTAALPLLFIYFKFLFLFLFLFLLLVIFIVIVLELAMFLQVNSQVEFTLLVWLQVYITLNKRA